MNRVSVSTRVSGERRKGNLAYGILLYFVVTCGSPWHCPRSPCCRVAKIRVCNNARVTVAKQCAWETRGQSMNTHVRRRGRITGIFNEIRYIRRYITHTFERNPCGRCTRSLGSPRVWHGTRACYVVKGHCATPGFRRESYTRCPRTLVLVPEVSKARSMPAIVQLIEIMLTQKRNPG